MLNSKYSNEPYAQTVIDHIQKYRQDGYKIEFYVGEFDFINADINKIEDLPEDFVVGDSHIEAMNINFAENDGQEVLTFECVDTQKQYEIPFSEWEDRIVYSKLINPEGREPTDVEVFDAVVKLAKRHNIPIDFIDKKEKEG